MDNDITEFIGWDKLNDLFRAMPNETIRDVQIASFLMAARITETLNSTKNMFNIALDEGYIEVKDFVVLKRWRKVDTVIICGRCQKVNDKFETQCIQCGANLVYGGHKKYITEKLEKKRLPFYIPLSERFVPLFIKRIQSSNLWLFPSPYTSRPYTRQWAYTMIKPLGNLVGLKSMNPKRRNEANLYNHWFRGQRLMQLGNEYGFDEMELKAFSGIVKSETLSRYVKKIRSYRIKMGLKL